VNLFEVGGRDLEVPRLGPRHRSILVHLNELDRRGSPVSEGAGPRGEFALQKKRWIVERTFGWLNRSRRLAKSFERTTQSDAAFVHVAMIHLMVKRLAKEGY
jgi:hypothetical protein